MTTETEPAASKPPFGLRDFFTADGPVIVAIGLNALVLFLLAFEELAGLPWLNGLDYVFTTFFLLEAVLKIQKLGAKGYFGVNWNRFDFALVIVSLPSYAMMFMELPDLSFLLLLRVARVVKFFRLIKFVPNIGGLVDGVRRAIRASSFVVLAFFIFNFIFALLSCHLFHSAAPEFFGNPVVSFYSTFKVFTVEGWYEIPDAIAEEATTGFAFFTRAYFMFIVIGGGLFGLSLVNAIFTEEMLRDENNFQENALKDIQAKLIALDGRLDQERRSKRARRLRLVPGSARYRGWHRRTRDE